MLLIFFYFFLTFFVSFQIILFLISLLLLRFLIFLLSFLIFLLCKFPIIFLLICVLIISFFFFVSSDFHPFNFTLMYGCIGSIYLYLIFQLWASYPSSWSLLTLVVYIDSFESLYFFLGAI